MTPADRHDLVTLLVTLRMRQDGLAAQVRELLEELHELTTCLTQLLERLEGPDAQDPLDTP